MNCVGIQFSINNRDKNRYLIDREVIISVYEVFLRPVFGKNKYVILLKWAIYNIIGFNEEYWKGTGS